MHTLAQHVNGPQLSRCIYKTYLFTATVGCFHQESACSWKERIPGEDGALYESYFKLLELYVDNKSIRTVLMLTLLQTVANELPNENNRFEI